MNDHDNHRELCDPKEEHSHCSGRHEHHNACSCGHEHEHHHGRKKDCENSCSCAACGSGEKETGGQEILLLILAVLLTAGSFLVPAGIFRSPRRSAS